MTRLKSLFPGSKYANFDYDLSQKMLTLLKGCYPARLKKVLIVTAPLWFKAPFKVLRLFVREKLRDRVFTVSLPQLLLHVPAEALPIELVMMVQIFSSAFHTKFLNLYIKWILRWLMSHTECVTDFDLQSKMIIFGSILTTFELSIIYGSNCCSNQNWLEPKTKPPSGNLACPNL